MMTILPATRFRLAALTVRETGALTLADVTGFASTPVGGISIVAGVAAIAGIGAQIFHAKSPVKAAMVGGAIAGAGILGRYAWQALGVRNAPTS
jgi:hypothetical protein